MQNLYLLNQVYANEKLAQNVFNCQLVHLLERGYGSEEVWHLGHALALIEYYKGVLKVNDTKVDVLQDVLT